MTNALQIDRTDNVATVLVVLGPMARVTWEPDGAVITREAVPEGHKVALVDIGAGEVVRKYGHPIGRAGRPIRAGEHVHQHNLAREEG